MKDPYSRRDSMGLVTAGVAGAGGETRARTVSKDKIKDI
jgi:hypothetical protein